MSQLPPHPISIPHTPNPIPCLHYNSPSPVTLLFTHGASGTLSTPSLANFASGYSAISPLLTFQGNMNLASRVKMFGAVREHGDTGAPVALGGRSMGARAAVVAASTDESTEALVLVSYPLRGPKGLRDEVLLEVGERVDVLFVSGDEDGMCDLEELRSVRARMTCRSWMVVVRGADHGMGVKPRARTEEVGRMTGRIAAEWVGSRQDDKTDGWMGWDEEEGRFVWSGWLAGEGNAGSNIESLKVVKQTQKKVATARKSTKKNDHRAASRKAGTVKDPPTNGTQTDSSPPAKTRSGTAPAVSGGKKRLRGGSTPEKRMPTRSSKRLKKTS